MIKEVDGLICTSLEWESWEKEEDQRVESHLEYLEEHIFIKFFSLSREEFQDPWRDIITYLGIIWNAIVQ